MAVATFTKFGNKATATAKLNKDVFGLEVSNHELLKRAYLAYLANGRLNLAVTKTRGDVSGGGKKPWRQKGTGRARVGSSRTPLWRGGGITFGPTGIENYTVKIPTQAKRTALRQALSLANNESHIIVIESIEPKLTKTSDLAKLLDKVGAKGNILIVVEQKTDELMRSTRNLPNVIVASAKYLNVYDLLNADHVVMTSGSLAVIDEWLGGKK